MNSLPRRISDINRKYYSYDTFSARIKIFYYWNNNNTDYKNKIRFYVAFRFPPLCFDYDNNNAFMHFHVYNRTKASHPRICLLFRANIYEYIYTEVHTVYKYIFIVKLLILFCIFIQFVDIIRQKFSLIFIYLVLKITNCSHNIWSLEFSILYTAILRAETWDWSRRANVLLAQLRNAQCVCKFITATNA